MKFDIKALALASGILWGACLFVIAWWLIAIGWAEGSPSLLQRVYIGYDFTPVGSVIGLAWGFVDGAIGGAIFAWLYNRLLAKPSAV